MSGAKTASAPSLIDIPTIIYNIADETFPDGITPLSSPREESPKMKRHQKPEEMSPAKEKIVKPRDSPARQKSQKNDNNNTAADQNTAKNTQEKTKHLTNTVSLLYSFAQEPWPKDVKLFQPYEVEQILLPDNANCLAVQAYLKMCHLDFQVECRANAEAMSPSGKVPFIKAGAFVISELEPIVQFVNGKGITLTADLEPEQRNDMRAYMSLVHNVLENAELYVCWCDKETYSEVTKPRYSSVYPWPLNHLQTWSKKSAIIKRLKLLGWYQKSLKEVYQEVENCCQALTDRLEGREYFFGNNGSELDALVYGHILSILTTPLPDASNMFTATVMKFKKLTEHSKRIHTKIMGKCFDLSANSPKKKAANVRFNEKAVSDVKGTDSVMDFASGDKLLHDDVVEVDDYYMV